MSSTYGTTPYLTGMNRRGACAVNKKGTSTRRGERNTNAWPISPGNKKAAVQLSAASLALRRSVPRRVRQGHVLHPREIMLTCPNYFVHM